MIEKAWGEVIEAPVLGRTEKPRETGITMILDKGLGLRATNDLVETAAPWVDIVKFSFGTSFFYTEDLCTEKIETLKEADILVMPGGTFLEVAVWKGKYDAYLEKAQELGFNAIEVSDGTIEMSTETRKTAIKKAVDKGFVVLTEVGKKDPKEEIPVPEIHDIIYKDMYNGAFKVIIEAREAGTGVGIFDDHGDVNKSHFHDINSGVFDRDCVLWEAPISKQQKFLIMELGINVDLGNIPPAEILALEALRHGLRGDTLKRAYLENKD